MGAQDCFKIPINLVTGSSRPRDVKTLERREKIRSELIAFKKSMI